MEGIVAKRRDGLANRKKSTWFKIKNPNYSQIEGRFDHLTRPSTVPASSG